MKEENINALDEIHKGSCMGMDALHFVLDKVEDNKLKKVSQEEYQQYEEIAKRIEEVYPKYNNDEPHKTNAMTKAMTWYGIEMLLKGVNMGIIEGRKILNKKKIDKEVNDIISCYVTMQEKSVEILKQYL